MLVYALCPVMNFLAAKAGHVDSRVWIAIVAQLFLLSVADMAFGMFYNEGPLRSHALI
jgi:hypothetical protein